MIGIIGAMDTEINELKENLTNIEEKKISNIIFYAGEIGNNKVVIAKSGMGKVFASICVEAMILNYPVDRIFHIGIAGALRDDMSIKDVVIASSVV